MCLCFPQQAGFRTKPRRRDKSPADLFICLRLRFRQKTGFKAESRRRGKFRGGLICLSGFMFLLQSGFKTKHRRRSKFPERWAATETLTPEINFRNLLIGLCCAESPGPELLSNVRWGGGGAHRKPKRKPRQI